MRGMAGESRRGRARESEVRRGGAALCPPLTEGCVPFGMKGRADGVGAGGRLVCRGHRAVF